MRFWPRRPTGRVASLKRKNGVGSNPTVATMKLHEWREGPPTEIGWCALRFEHNDFIVALYYGSNSKELWQKTLSKCVAHAYVKGVL